MKNQKINYNSLMNNLNDLNKIGFDENKFLINSERNKNYKIIFKQEIIFLFINNN